MRSDASSLPTNVARRRARACALACTAVLLLASMAACDGRGPAPGATADAICGATSEVFGTVESPELVEISGLAASRTNEGVLWAHNDSGDTARVFAIGPRGEHLGTYTLADTEAIDWEDMAIGPGPEDDTDYLYLADIGDNQAQRATIVVYRVPEPEVRRDGTPTSAELTGVEQLTLRYPDGAHDAEIFLVDPSTGDMFIVTKELQLPASFVFRAPAFAEPGIPLTLEQVGQIDFKALPSRVEVPPDAPQLVRGVPHLPTGGDVSPDGRLVAIRTYATVWVWVRQDDTPLWEAFSGVPCEAPAAIEQQGEAIAFHADGTGYTTVSEGAGAPLNHFEAK